MGGARPSLPALDPIVRLPTTAAHHERCSLLTETAARCAYRSARAFELGGALSSVLPHALELTYLGPPKSAFADEEVPVAEGEAVAVEAAEELPPSPTLLSPTGRRRRLILRAGSEDERLRWIDGLQARIRFQAACIAHGGSACAYPSDSMQHLHMALPNNRAGRAASTEDAVAGAIAAATLAARSAAARAESAAVAADVCIAMGASEPRRKSEDAGGGGSGLAPALVGATRRGRGAPALDIEAFLMQRQREVIADLETIDLETAEQTQVQMLIAMGATPTSCSTPHEAG